MRDGDDQMCPNVCLTRNFAIIVVSRGCFTITLISAIFVLCWQLVTCLIQLLVIWQQIRSSSLQYLEPTMCYCQPKLVCIDWCFCITFLGGRNPFPSKQSPKRYRDPSSCDWSCHGQQRGRGTAGYNETRP